MPTLKVWRRLHPLLVGRDKLNPQWIAKHYDARNIQHHAMDRQWFTYTPGIYDDENDSMEVGAERKLGFAFDKLRLRPGDHLLEVGCGWGGMTRFSARRGVRMTGITLSRDQLAFTEERIREERLDARALYQDFFTFEPDERNYHLWTKKGHARWLQNKDLVVSQSSIETFRLFRLLFAGTCAGMDSPDHEVTAFRVVLELPRDAGGRAHPSLGGQLDGVFAGARLARNVIRS